MLQRFNLKRKIDFTIMILKLTLFLLVVISAVYFYVSYNGENDVFTSVLGIVAIASIILQDISISL